MVCIPCIVIPVLLWIFHKYIQPIVLKFWNPWASKSVSGPQDSGGDHAACDTVSCIFVYYTAEVRYVYIYLAPLVNVRLRFIIIIIMFVY